MGERMREEAMRARRTSRQFLIRGTRIMNRPHWKQQRGVAVVEFALVLPLLLLILFGIVEFGLVMFDQAVITNASREGARAGIVLKSPKASTTDIQNVALNYCQTHLISLGSASTPTVAVPSGQGGSFGTPLTVTVTYKFTGLALGSWIGPLTKLLTLTATTVMNNE
ncbi:pilus assembly protein TadE [Burkholderia sp. AU33647]|nr:pilus assembly protein TadE [Burkholderia sp. AU33647]